MIVGLLMDVTIQEQDQARQAPLQELNFSSQLIDTCHRLTQGCGIHDIPENV
jgi:hypothetical protein